MTEALFLSDSYLREATSRVTGHTLEGGIVLDASIFYATSGGQPGDAGRLVWDGGGIDIGTTVKGQGRDIVLVPAEPARLPDIGTFVKQALIWDRRHRMMRVHTALHLLSVVIPRPVTGGQIAADKGRLDFDMEHAPEDKDAITAALNDLIARDLPVTAEWMPEAVLDRQPALVKTMTVKPPRGQGPIRLIRIGEGDETVDLQPCGGTHVGWTGEIGRVRIGKIEKKGRQNRRVYLHLEDA
ncbi:alanyl-tRNA editing protein [Loktanella salsilacus]|uniref:alanyl-tRNA editing protein n=1 Tax=Loktanella salsilacus TaxID=195913 RepID=UPI0037365118